MFFMFLCYLLCQGVLGTGNEVHVSSASDLRDISLYVNNGESYSGTTVFLDNDVDFSGSQPTPIGSYSKSFQGTFDGQGYTISKLAMTSSSSYQTTGLFGYTKGGTIRNVVLDSSCSTKSSYTAPYSIYVGGVVGYCIDCTIENTVNLASTTYTGTTGSSLYLGGIAGCLYASSKEAIVRNCANYGSVTHSGTSDNDVRIGGIVGGSDGNSPKYIQNCHSFGTITCKGTVKNYLYAGGTLGYTQMLVTENCMNTGEITLVTKGSINYIGSIAGFANSYTNITSCHWTSNIGYEAFGKKTSDQVWIDEGTSEVSLNLSTVGTLNEYATKKGWNNWLLNTNNKLVTFKVNNNNGFSLSSQIILIPNVAEKKAFLWFSDAELTEQFTSNEITAEATLYGGLGYVITFDSDGGTVIPTTKAVAQNNAYGLLPTPIKAGYKFNEWYNNKGNKVNSTTIVTTASDHTLTAKWTPNSYTVTFNATGGTVDPPSKVVIYNSTYGDLPIPITVGCDFDIWLTEIVNGTEVSIDTKVTVPNDHTIYAHWLPRSYTVTFNASRGTVAPETKQVTFSEGYGELPTPIRAGYAFTGWFNSEDKEVSSITVIETANNHTLTARWALGNYTVTFNAKGGAVSPASKSVTFYGLYGELPEAKKVDDVFLWWYLIASDGSEEKTTISPETNVTTPENHTLYAAWGINTVIFDFGNGTKIGKQVKYNEPVPYPENPTREGLAFIGWDKNIAAMPAEDIIITALWEMRHSGNEGDSKGVSALAFGLVVALFIIVIVLMVLIFIFYRKNNKNASSNKRRDFELDNPHDYNTDDTSYLRAGTMTKEEVSGSSIAGKGLNSLFKMYPPNYVRPTMKVALLNAVFTDKQADRVVEACKSSADYVKVGGKLFEGFTEEDAAAVAMYTYDFGPGEFEHNPYRIINTSLVGRNFNNLQKASGILYLVMTALRKLPRVTGMTLYRGLRSEINLDKGHYHEGNTITWPALSSTSPDLNTTKAFLAKGTKTGKAEGTLFIIENGWGYDIQPYSLFPEEAEILLEPERQFEVVSVIQANLTVVTLKMLDTPLALPQVFGDGKK